jgi:hypothetical protein
MSQISLKRINDPLANTVYFVNADHINYLERSHHDLDPEAGIKVRIFFTGSQGPITLMFSSDKQVTEFIEDLTGNESPDYSTADHT